MAVKSPIDIKDPTLRLTILVDGQPMKDYFPVLSVEITLEVNKISNAELTIIYDGLEAGSGFDLGEGSSLVPGKSIEIKAGYGSEETSVFKGVIVRQKVQVKSGNTFNLVVTCKHSAVELTYSKEAVEFEQKKDSDVIKSIVQSSKTQLSCTADDTQVVMENMRKRAGTSDWDFILTRAEFNGYIVTLDGDAINVVKPKLTDSPVLRVAFGESIISFNAEINTENQPSSVVASAWDIKELKELEVTSEEPTLSGPLKSAIETFKAQQKEIVYLRSNTTLTQDELKTWANSRLLRMRLAAFKGQVSFIGNADVKPGTNIELGDVGKDRDGNVFVSSVTHSITDGQWTTTVKFGLEDKSITAKSDFSPPAAAGQVPPAHGLQVGTVKKIYEDPDANLKYRIQVSMPSGSDKEEDVWARVSNFYATQNAGSVFFPEVGDEVVVGFFESDPRFPVVLGSLYSSSKTCPSPPADNNNYIKTITTKSNLKITFDDEKKQTTIETPAGNKITLSDDSKSIEIQDQNSNVVKMTSGGIDLQSNKDINLKATGNITLDATGKVNISAKQDVAVAGLNIDNSAQAGFTAKGNATAELSASGQTTVKGGMVMIN